jgi:hypothetical protein
LQNIFRFIGLREKAGSGADIIAKGWEENHWARPTIKDSYFPSEEIYTILGEEAEWREARKDGRIMITKRLDVVNQSNWEKAFNWYLQMAPLFKKCAKLEK